MQTDLAIGPAGDVWVMNNWQDIDSCFGIPSEVLSTRCGGQGVTIFFGMAKPVRAPQIGPARSYGDMYRSLSRSSGTRATPGLWSRNGVTGEVERTDARRIWQEQLAFLPPSESVTKAGRLTAITDIRDLH